MSCCYRRRRRRTDQVAEKYIRYIIADFITTIDRKIVNAYMCLPVTRIFL